MTVNDATKIFQNSCDSFDYKKAYRLLLRKTRNRIDLNEYGKDHTTLYHLLHQFYQVRFLKENSHNKKYFFKLLEQVLLQPELPLSETFDSNLDQRAWWRVEVKKSVQRPILQFLYFQEHKTRKL